MISVLNNNCVFWHGTLTTFIAYLTCHTIEDKYTCNKMKDSFIVMHNNIIWLARIVCIRPNGRTQCIFPRSQHSCLYVYIYWPKVNLYQVVVSQQSVRTLFKSLAQLFVYIFLKWPLVAILDVQKSLCIDFLAISDQYHNFVFLWIFFTKWLPFWMSEDHFLSHFWQFQINTKFVFLNIKEIFFDSSLQSLRT